MFWNTQPKSKHWLNPVIWILAQLEDLKIRLLHTPKNSHGTWKSLEKENHLPSLHFWVPFQFWQGTRTGVPLTIYPWGFPMYVGIDASRQAMKRWISRGPASYNRCLADLFLAPPKKGANSNPERIGDIGKQKREVGSKTQKNLLKSNISGKSLMKRRFLLCLNLLILSKSLPKSKHRQIKKYVLLPKQKWTTLLFSECYFGVV